MECIIDTRENKIKKYFLNESKSTIKNLIKTENLDIGDIVFKYKGEIILLIERKTIEDLGSSILDGRHKEQKFRILNSNIPLSNILFLVEGKMVDLDFGNIKKNTLQGSILNTLFRDGIKVYRTLDIKETIYFIERFLEKFLKDGVKNIKTLIPQNENIENNPNLNYIDVKKVKKKNNLTPEVFNKLVLLQIPGVSNNIVERIFKEYNSIKNILDSYNKIDKLDLSENEKTKQKENILTNLEMSISNNKKRKIGKVISKRIYNFLQI
tara:strand:+ start:908 stop:1708 length:801 start_codon:yes stop_codon:yes gene_type:complete